MFRSVVIALDGSELADRVLGPLHRLLAGDTREVVLLRVIPGPSEPEPRLRHEALAHLDPLRERLAGQLPEAAVRTELGWGDPAGEILRFVDAARPDLLAMATHGRSGWTRLARGSVAERVLRRCPVPLLLCNPTSVGAGEPAPVPFQRVLVPLDGSEAADAVLPRVEEVARTYGAEVTLVGVEPVLYATPPLSGERAGLGWSPARVEQELRARRDRLRRAGVTARIAASSGNEAEEILKAARNADLVAMTTHGRSGLSRWWFGSVAEQVLRQCTAPVLVQRVAGPGAGEER